MITEDRIIAIPLLLTGAIIADGREVFRDEIEQWNADNSGSVELFWIDVPVDDHGWMRKLYFAVFKSYEDLLHFKLRWL